MRRIARRLRLGPRPAAIGAEVPALVAAGRAAGRPRQSGGGRHSPRAGRVLGPARAGCGSSDRSTGRSAWIGRPPANGLGHRRRGAAALARGPAGLGPPDAAGFVDGRGAAALRPAKGMRRSGANDFHGRRDAVGPVAGPAADPPRVAQPAPGAGLAAPPQRPAAAARRCGSRNGSGGNSRKSWARRPRRPRTACARAFAPRSSPRSTRSACCRRTSWKSSPAKKLVEELLDRIVERGFLTLGEVRDAVSRNHLKQPDCAGLATSSAATPCCG